MNPAFHRYARALYDLSQDQGIGTNVCGDLLDFQELTNQNPPLAGLLARPFVGSHAVSRVLHRIGQAKGYQDITTSFLALMARRGRARHILDAIGFFMTLKNQGEGTVALTVTSAFPLNRHEKETINQTLQTLTQQTPSVSFASDPDLLGGVVIRHPAWVIDGSLKGQLKRIGHALKSNTTHHS